jgi:hypothetical protein
MKRGAKLSERGDCMAKEVELGASFREVAERYGISAVAVFKACERRGVLSKRSPRNLRSFSDNPGSSSGRTSHFECENLGSNPSPGASIEAECALRGR